jgi:hypothetical protein
MRVSFHQYQHDKVNVQKKTQLKKYGVQQCGARHSYITYTGQGWTDIYMDMRLGLTEVTMLFMVFGSLVTRRKPIPCSPSDDSVTAHNTTHSHRNSTHQTRGKHRVGFARTLYNFVMANLSVSPHKTKLPNMRSQEKYNT